MTILADLCADDLWTVIAIRVDDVASVEGELASVWHSRSPAWPSTTVTLVGPSGWQYSKSLPSTTEYLLIPRELQL